jgi:hypothetical protein
MIVPARPLVTHDPQVVSPSARWWQRLMPSGGGVDLVLPQELTDPARADAIFADRSTVPTFKFA